MNKVTSLIAEATNVNTSPKRLRELLNHADYGSANLGLYLVSNPNTPLDVLLELGEKYPKEFLANPALDLYLLVDPNLLREMPYQTLLKIVDTESVPEIFLRWAVERCARSYYYYQNIDDRDILEAILEDHNLSDEIIFLLAKELGYKVTYTNLAYQMAEKLDIPIPANFNSSNISHQELIDFIQNQLKYCDYDGHWADFSDRWYDGDDFDREYEQISYFWHDRKASIFREIDPQLIARDRNYYRNCEYFDEQEHDNYYYGNDYEYDILSDEYCEKYGQRQAKKAKGKQKKQVKKGVK